MTSSQWQRGQAGVALEKGGAQEPRGHPPISPCSEPDLITAHTGHSIDIAQHREPDETSAGEEATRLRVQQLWPAVILSRLPVGWFPSGIWSEVVELEVGREGHVLPGQAHVVEFQVVGVTRDQRRAPGRAFGLLLFPADQAGHQCAEPHQGTQGKPSGHDDAQQWHFHSGGQKP